MSDDKKKELVRDIAAVLNRHCVENESNTPDFILAEMLVVQLAAWATATRAREKWFGAALSIGASEVSR